MSSARPLLSICIPTYNRADLLGRALTSITTAQVATADLEIIVSDNSDNDESRLVTERILGDWSGRWRYVHNDPGLYVIDNFNHAITHANSTFVLSLGDDDYFLEGGVANALSALKSQPDYDCFLLGVYMVTLERHVLKRQTVRQNIYLEPKAAYLRVLSDSSYVRESGMILRKTTFDKAGQYDPATGNLADLDMWLRLFKTTGLYRVAGAAVAVTAHAGAITSAASFQKDALDDIIARFERERVAGFVNEESFERASSKFFYQYVLAGVARSVRAGQLKQARAVFELLSESPLNKRAIPDKWFFPWLGASIFFRFYDMGKGWGLAFSRT